MIFSKSTPESNILEYGSILAGISTSGYTAIIPRFYRSVGGVSVQPSRFFVAVLLSPICGSFAVFSWHHLVSIPIKIDKLNCAACASIRGSLILVLNGCVLPSFAIASLYFRKKTSLPYGVVGALHDFCYSPYYGRSKFFIMALGGFQATFGYALASWMYNEEFMKKRNNEKRCN